MGKRRKRKALASLSLAIQEHRKKIAEQNAFSNPDWNLIRYWKKEIEHFERRMAQIRRQLTKHATRRRREERK